jgi:hypothetical protein
VNRCGRKPESSTPQLLRCPCINPLNNNDPDADDVVGEAREEGLAVSGPGERGALWLAGGLGEVWEVGSEVVDDGLRLEVEDLDRRGGGGAEPVPVGGEDEGVDDVSGLEGVEVLALVQVPEHGDAVLATGSGERSVGRDGEGVDVTGVAEVVGLKLALGKLPNLRKMLSAQKVPLFKSRSFHDG